MLVEVKRDPLDFVSGWSAPAKSPRGGDDPTGKRVAENWYGSGAQDVVVNYERVVASRLPLRFDRSVRPGGRRVQDESLFLPLATDGEEVGQIMVYSYLRRHLGRLAPDRAETVAGPRRIGGRNSAVFSDLSELEAQCAGPSDFPLHKARRRPNLTPLPRRRRADSCARAPRRPRNRHSHRGDREVARAAKREKWHSPRTNAGSYQNLSLPPRLRYMPRPQVDAPAVAWYRSGAAGSHPGASPRRKEKPTLASITIPKPDLDGKSILVTGGTGSFGKAFIRHVLKHYKPRRLVSLLARRAEAVRDGAGLLVATSTAACASSSATCATCERLEMAMRGIDYVIHAAALKQVPTAEYNPFECIHTNVLGAENVVQAAHRATKCKRVIALSTDKAANPINLYGASKLASDKIFVAANNLSRRHRRASRSCATAT